MRISLTPSQQAVLGLLGKSLFGQKYDLPENTDIPALIRECRLQAVTAVALSALDISRYPQLTQALYTSIANNNRVFSDHTELHRLMTENNIPYVILKGAASAHYYPEPLLRAMGDVDFLVKPEDMDKVRALLLSDGFVFKDEKDRFHYTFIKKKTHLEAHFAFAENINPEIDRQIDEYLSDIIENANYISEQYCSCMIPSLFQHGLILLLHMQKHMLRAGLGLRHLCDWAVFVNSFDPNEFSELFKEKLEKIGLWRYAQIVSLSAHIGLGLPYADFMGDDYSTAEELLEDILTSGNFGRRDQGRLNEGLFIERKADAGKDSTRVSAFIYQVNCAIKNYWPCAGRNNILLLIGWIYFGCRRVIRTILGIRKPLHLINSYKSSASRKELYDKLHLFETEN